MPCRARILPPPPELHVLRRHPRRARSSRHHPAPGEVRSVLSSSRPDPLQIHAAAVGLRMPPLFGVGAGGAPGKGRVGLAGMARAAAGNDDAASATTTTTSRPPPSRVPLL
uniref:p0044F08.21 protein n=1 Tax=Oryza sativa subsp. japonica TaxID=39947 RepID=Q7F762_ORYSJ|nr:P0044F08.21 [Oryza sativa Japonica Group]